ITGFKSRGTEAAVRLAGFEAVLFIKNLDRQLILQAPGDLIELGSGHVLNAAIPAEPKIIPGNQEVINEVVRQTVAGVKREGGESVEADEPMVSRGHPQHVLAVHMDGADGDPGEV